ncbi:MAG: HAMP domain-containing protein, partial [Verrucomicrobia bacterium]|nr:HAMP domain-containing protein [Verrucomicrobiota bacterium]
MVIILLASSSVLLLACVGFVAYDQIKFQQGMESDLKTLAKIIGSSSSFAASMEDQNVGKELLDALQAQKRVVSACLYSASNKVVAVYTREGWAGPPPPARPASNEAASPPGYLSVFQPLDYHGERTGTLFVQYSMEEMSTRLRTFLGVVAVIFGMAVALVVVISSRLQRIISQPILELARTAKVVSEEKNYTVRAVKQNEDEVGFLIDRFNEMLGRIDEREKELEKV